jgi:hypothetical protein
MDWADYVWDEAAKFRQLAEAAEDLSIKQEFLDLAAFARRQPITSRIVCRAANLAMRHEVFGTHNGHHGRRSEPRGARGEQVTRAATSSQTPQSDRIVVELGHSNPRSPARHRSWRQDHGISFAAKLHP